MLVDIAKLDVKLKCRNTVLINDDFRRVRLRDHHYSGFVTSPPYLNRLDYVVSHLGPISLLSTLFTIDADDLRRSMMGTTKMVEKRDPDPSFGPLCLATLEQIKTHTSKASSTYYYWFYVKYFRDLREALCTLQRCCVSGAQGVVVLQNSYYKDVLVPVPEILVELATLLNLRAVVVRDHIIRTHLGVLDPSQKKYVPSKTLKESVVRIEVAGQ